jgi:uncharacterized membrane protein
LVPALIGLLSVPLLYVAVYRLLGRQVALVSAALLAIAPWHLYWSQHARFYTLLLVFYTAALIFFYYAIEEDRLAYMLLSLVMLGFAIQERYFSLMFVGVAATYLVLLLILNFKRPPGYRVRNISIFFVPLFVAGIVVAIPFLMEPSEWLRRFGHINNNPLWLIAGTVYYIRVPTVVMALLGAAYLLLRKERVGLLLVVAALMPVVFMVALSPFHYTANRYLFVTLPPWIILAAYAAVELLRHVPRQSWILATGVLLLLFLDPLSENVLYYEYHKGNREDYRAAFELIRDSKAQGDLVVTNKPELAHYYLGEAPTGMALLARGRIAPGQQRMWIVEDMSVRQAYPQFHRWMLEHSILVGNFDNHVHARTFIMRVYLYDPAVTPP